ncbi:MAG: helix-turn-helix domain-containing protein [Planctomycetota bacterium]|jgi:AraC-like DNA-binding protein
MRHPARPPFGRNSAGQKSQPPDYGYESGDYDLFQVICVLRGRLFFESRGEETALGPGGLAVLRLGSGFRLHTGRVGYQGVYFIAADEDRPSYRGGADALVADPETLLLAEMMDREIASPGRGSSELLEGLGRAMAWRAIRLCASPAPADPERHWAEVARGALEATLTTGRAAREVLASLGISYRQLSRYFSRVHGESPKQYQIRARLLEAQRLLEDTSWPVTSIAFELGYPSSQHFATQFRRATGLTPSSWRRRGAHR